MIDVATEAGRGAVIIRSRPLWQIRLLRGLPRYLLSALAAAGIVASARFAIAPPRPRLLAPAPVGPEPADRAAEGYAALFARRYLSWTGSEPLSSARALAPFAGAAMEADAGLRLPPSGEQHVEWVEVVQAREPQPDEHVYTVAAQTDTAGLVYLTVSVQRQADGSLALAGYPAFVGPPAYGAARTRGQLREVTDVALQTVVERALRNYLAGSESNLAADLTGDARVSLPRLGLTVLSVGHLHWAAGGGAVLALVQAQDGRGVRYALDYEVDVARPAGRWEVSAVQMEPNT
ncbi:MAG: conjugal transfer protein [Actinobacteria bacterium]|nr:MAG: conjugal transfer protein [Actinomycetota bacterium]